MCVQNLKSVALPAYEIGLIGGTTKNFIRPRPLFSTIFNGVLNVPAKFKVCSYTRSWDNSDWGFGVGVANPQSWGRGGRKGSWIVPFEGLGALVKLHIRIL